MAKQSFVTGQVLTAQQVNDLQTNDFNQTVSNKTASYTLVAADKGTRITMSSTSATTITVNTGLFAAGDTLFIQNLNTGVCTITAGTATVDTSASLALAQHEGGTLYFTSAGASTFFKAAGAAPAGGGMTLLSTTTLSGATTTISSINQTYKSIVLYFERVNAGSGGSFFVNPNANTILVSQITNYGENGSTYAITHNDSKLQLPGNLGANKPDNAFTLIFDNYASTTCFKPFNFYGYYEYHSPFIEACFHSGGAYRSNTAITSIDINIASGTFSAGTVKLYGVN